MNRRHFFRTGVTGAAAAGIVGASGGMTPAVATTNPAPVIPGGVLLDSFAGSTDDQKFANALAHIAAQTYRPALLLDNRVYTLSGTYNLFNDFSMYGIGMEREFSKQTVVQAKGAALFRVPTGLTDNRARNVTLQGISFIGTSSTDFLAPVALDSGPILAYSDIRECGFKLFRRVMSNRILGTSLDDIYCNNSYDTPFTLAGSDNYVGTGGHFFLDSQYLTADKYLMRFTHMSRTDVGAIYITGTKATPLRIDGGYGMTFTASKFDARAGNAAIATQGAAVVITNGTGITFNNCWFFNVMAAPANTGNAALHKGYITVTGGEGVLVSGCRFDLGTSSWHSNTPPGTPLVYASGGKTIICRANLATQGQQLVYKQSKTGLIDADAAVQVG